MDDENNSVAHKGMGLCDFVFLVFLILKLTGKIDWSWWWVTAPLWISFIVYIILAVIMTFIIKRR